jgi:hypothetical protein
MTVGTFTSTPGVSTGTVNVTGVRFFGYGFETNDSGGDVDRATLTDSGTTGLLTCTVENQTAVADGRFWILHQ